MDDQSNLLSSVSQKGDVVDQVIIMISGVKKTYRGVVSSSIEQGEFTKFQLLDGRLIMVNTKNVAFVEIYGRENVQPSNL